MATPGRRQGPKERGPGGAGPGPRTTRYVDHHPFRHIAGRAFARSAHYLIHVPRLNGLDRKEYGLFNTLPGVILVYVATELPITIYLLRAFFAQIPQEMEEAARIDGCTD